MNYHGCEMLSNELIDSGIGYSYCTRPLFGIVV